MDREEIRPRSRNRSGARRAGGRSGVVLAVVLLVAGAACGADVGHRDATTGTTEPVTTGVGGDLEHYAVLDARGWTLDAAVDPAPDDPFTSHEQPPVDWWSEWSRSTPFTAPGFPGTGISVDQVRLSRHAGAPDDLATAYERLGWSFEPTEISGRPALVGTAAPNAPAVVSLPWGEATVLLLSYQLTGDELLALAAQLRPVDAAGWIAVGGVVR